MKKKAISFVVFSFFLLATTSLVAQHKDISKLIEDRVKIVDNQQSFQTHGVTYNHGRAPQVNNRDGHFSSTLIDSSRNGYGAYYKTTNPLAYGVGEGYFAVYRQWITEMTTHGVIGAAQSEDGEDWSTSQELNMKYPTGEESPDLPTANGQPQGRYPSAGYSEGAKPTAIWNEYTLNTQGGGTSGGYPLHTFNSLGMGEDSYWIDPVSQNTGCGNLPCDPPDLWNGNAMLIPTGGGSMGDYKFLGAYSTWASGEEKTYMLTSYYHTSGNNLMSDPYILSDDLEVTDELDSLWLGAGYISTPDYHINSNGDGYLVQMGWGNLTDTDGDDNDVDLMSDNNQGIFIKATDDFGETWTDDGGFKNSGYQVFPDDVALRLTDSLYTIWTEEENEYYYHYGDSLYYEADTLEDGTLIPFLMTPGWIVFYTFEMRTDAEGGLHIVFPMLRNICMDYNGGCDDSDGDGFADSSFINISMGGQGIIHVYSPDPMAGVDNWTASFIHDMSIDYDADWTSSNIRTLFHDGSGDYLGTMQYFYPNITMSAESEGTMWFAISGLSMYDTEYDEDSTETYIPTDIDVFMAKSTDNGHHWSEVENVTNTVTSGAAAEGGYPSEAALESGVHLANQGMDETVGVFYQMMDPNVMTITDNDGYEDYKNWVYVGIYENDWEYTELAIGDEMLPEAFTLKQNYPNPFNPLTQIRYDVNEPGLVTLDLFDIRGAKVKTLINKKQTAGSYEFTFNGSQMASGVYFYTMTSNQLSQTRKFVLMK
ncbi:MAG: T9SS type A sorting domain-containing protein [Candidatus Marinimicrobia bacterium]|nr:T9SS type A sorting domain-containing protein [Candidatus Neomarinimicrobiota bacterium]